MKGVETGRGTRGSRDDSDSKHKAKEREGTMTNNRGVLRSKQ